MKYYYQSYYFQERAAIYYYEANLDIRKAEWLAKLDYYKYGSNERV